MPIPDPLRTARYASGVLVQTCSECQWAWRGHQQELDTCPACAARMSPTLALVFGGLAVIRRGGDFEVRDPSGRSVRIEDADSNQVIQFICRYANDYRDVGQPGDPYPPRPVPNAEGISGLLWPKS